MASSQDKEQKWYTEHYHYITFSYTSCFLLPSYTQSSHNCSEEFPLKVFSLSKHVSTGNFFYNPDRHSSHYTLVISTDTPYGNPAKTQLASLLTQSPWDSISLSKTKHLNISCRTECISVLDFTPIHILLSISCFKWLLSDTFLDHLSNILDKN